MKLPQVDPTAEQRERALRRLRERHPQWPADLASAEADPSKSVAVHAVAVALARRDLKQQRTRSAPLQQRPAWMNARPRFDHKRASANDLDDQLDG